MLTARVDDLRLALLAILTALGGGSDPELCRAILDEAAEHASEASAQTLAALRIGDPVGVRFNAPRVLNSICAVCRGCERGRDPDTPPTITLPAPQPERQTSPAEPRRA